MSQNIKWTSDEWVAVARALMKTHPEYETSLPPIVFTPDLRKAMEVLPEERRRPVSNGAGNAFRAGLSKAYETILTGNQSALAPRERIFWTRDEFLKLAAALHAEDPGAGYIYSTALASLTPTALRRAQEHALPPDRRRNIITVSAERPRLVEAFAQLRAAIEQQAKAAVPPVVPQPAPQPQPAPGVNPYEAVFRPLVDMLMGELMRRITEVYPPNGMPQPSPQQRPGEQNPQLQYPAPFHPPRKPKVGLIGPMSQQAQDIAKTFPQLEIVCVPSSDLTNAVAALSNSVKIIAMTKFIDHSSYGRVKKAYSDRFTHVDGGTSAIKRQIQMWLTTGALAQ